MKLDDYGNVTDYGAGTFDPPAPSTRRFTFTDPPAVAGDTGSASDAAAESARALAAQNAATPPTPAAPKPKGTQSPDYITQLIQGGMSPQDAAAKYNTDFGTTEAQYYDPSQHGGHATIGLPGSYLTDEDSWSKATTRMPEGGGAAAAGPAAGGGSASGDSSGSALSSFLTNWLSNPSTASTGNRNALFDRLLGLADQYSKPVTADDPNIKASSDAYHGESARAVQNFRTRAAERAHAQGVGTGSFDASIGNAEMAAGRSEATNTTSLMNTELQSRRQALSSTLQQAGASLDSSDRAELQSKLDAIDGLLRGQSNDTTIRGQDITSQLGNKGLDITKLLGLGSQDIQNTGVTNQNNQFYDKLGVDSASNSAQLDLLWHELGLK